MIVADQQSRPMIVDLIGSYRTTLRTGLVTGVGAGGAIVASRWTDASFQQRLRAIEVEFTVTTGFTAAQEFGFDVVIGRSWSVAPSGGAAATLTGDNNNKVVGDAAAKVGQLLVSTTAALTNGTVTADANAIAAGQMWCAAGAAGGSLQRAWRFDADERNEPVLLAANEGLLLRNLVAMGAAGVVRGIVTLEWDEVLVQKR